MNKLGILSILILTLFQSCQSEKEKLLIGKWKIEKFEISTELSDSDKDEITRIEGSVIEFKSNGDVLMEIDGEAHQTLWEIDGMKLKIKNGVDFDIKELSKEKLILSGEVEMMKNGEPISIRFNQIMKKIGQ